MIRIYLIALLILCSTIAHSQKISIGFRSGLMANSPPFSAKNYMDNPKGGNSFIWGITLAFNIPLFQIGVGVDYSHYKYELAASPGSRNTIEPSAPLTISYVFINYKIPLPKSYVYVGAQGGYAKLGYMVYNYTLAGGTSSGGGLSAGVQVGYCFNLSDKWSIQAEAGPRYIPVYAYFYTPNNSKTVFNKTAAYIVPATLGINYRF